MSASSESVAMQVLKFRQEWDKAYWQESNDIESTFEHPTLLDLLSGSLKLRTDDLPQIRYFVNSLWGQVADAVDCAIPDLGQSIENYHVPKAFYCRRHDGDWKMAKMVESVHKNRRVKNGEKFIANARWYVVDLGST